MNYSQLLTFLAPETLVVLATLGVLFVDLTTLRSESVRTRLRWGAGLTVLIGLYPRLLLDLIVPALQSPLMSKLLKGGGA